MNFSGINDQARPDHLLHRARKWVQTPEQKAAEEKRIAEERAKARRTICRNSHNIQDRTDLLEEVGLIQRVRGKWVLA